MTIHIPKTPEILAVAKKVVWFKEPEKTLENPYHFLAYLMTYGLPEDVITVQKYLTLKHFKEALEHAPAGVFDQRSWAYWNLMCHRYPPPEMPQRPL